MTYHQDLTLYQDLNRKIRQNILNIGWLSADNEFTVGQVSPELIDKVFIFCRNPVNQTRGFHECEFCNNRNFRQPAAVHNGKLIKMGDAEIVVFGKNNQAYAAPTLVFHYITDHNYQPPEEFLRALESSPLPGTDEYKTLLKQFGMQPSII